MSGCRAGESDSFERLFDLYKDYVYSVAFYLTRREDMAADVVQEVFLKLVDRVGSFKGRSKWTTWLYRVVYNTSLDARRRSRPLVPLEEVAPPMAPAEADPERRLARKESAGVLREAVGRLSPKLRAPLVLHYVAGLRYEEIAAILDVSAGTVASRLSRARERLATEVRRAKLEVP